MKGTGLKPLKRSAKDYSTKKTLGYVPLPYLPKEYDLDTTVLDQGSDNICTAAASAAVKEAETGKRYDMYWYYAKEMQVQGAVSLQGTDLRVSLDTGRKFGHLPLGMAPANYAERPFAVNADWKNWSEELDKYADKDGVTLMVDGPYDNMDDARSCMYINKKTKTTLKGGLMWMNEWDNAPDGIITSLKGTPKGGHEIKISGWTLHKKDGSLLPPLPNNDPYIKFQNSWATGVGDKGFFYMPRDLYNKAVARYGVGYSLPYSRDELEIETMGRIRTLLQQIVDLLNKLVNPLGIHLLWKF